MVNGRDGAVSYDETRNLIPSAEDKMAYTKTKMEDITTNKDTEDKLEGDFDIENSIFRDVCPICSENVPIDCVFLDLDTAYIVGSVVKTSLLEESFQILPLLDDAKHMIPLHLKFISGRADNVNSLPV